MIVIIQLIRPKTFSSKMCKNAKCTYNPLLFNPVLDSDQFLFVMHINTRSLQHNFEYLNDLLLQMKFQPDILCVRKLKLKSAL